MTKQKRVDIGKVLETPFPETDGMGEAAKLIGKLESGLLETFLFERAGKPRSRQECFCQNDFISTAIRQSGIWVEPQFVRSAGVETE
ncbi:hypothetical protein ROS1_57550 [Roseibium sp. ROS1]